MLRFAEIPLGSGGLSCGRCGRSESPSYDPTDEVVERLKSAVEGWDTGAGPNVSFTGPEPFGHAELPALVSVAVQSGVRRIRLESDASAMTEGNTAQAVVAAGIRHLRVVLLGASSDSHDALSGRKGALEATANGVAAYREAAQAMGAKVAVSALVPVCSHDLGELPGTVMLASVIGCSALAVRLDEEFDEALAAPVLEAACDTGTVNGLWVSVHGAPEGLREALGLHYSEEAP